MSETSKTRITPDGWLRFVEVIENGERKALECCHIEECCKPATQAHGFYPDFIKTCDEHAEQVMLELLGAL